MTLKQALDWKAAERITKWPPWQHYSYSSVGFSLAEYIVEKVSEQAFEKIIDERIFTPLGMYSASLDNDERTLSHLATGYDSDGKSVIPYLHMLYRGFGAINLRPGDMIPFLQMLLNKGKHKTIRLLTAESIERLETPTTSLAAKNGLQFGRGLGNYTSMRNGLLFHGHDGDADGYLSRLSYNRDTKLGYFRVINAFKNNALLKLRYRIEDFISEDKEILAPPIPVLNDNDLKRYSGIYTPVTKRFSGANFHDNTLKMSVNDGILRLYSDNVTRDLLPVNRTHFRYQGESQATSAFVMDE